MSDKSDPPYFGMGSFSYYIANRGPTKDEPDINPGYLDASQIVHWQDYAYGRLYYLTKPAVNGSLVWKKIADGGLNKENEMNDVKEKQDPPQFESGSFNYYFADRDPTPEEPDITSVYLDNTQLIYWQNYVNGRLFYMTKPAIQGKINWYKVASATGYKSEITGTTL